MKIPAIGLSAVLLVLSGFQAGAMEPNPFSIIKGAVEAVAEDRASGDITKDLEIKASLTADVIDKMGTDAVSVGIVKEFKGDTGVTNRVKVRAN